MTTITKEWLQKTIAEFENTRDDIPFDLSDDDARILIVLKRALASLEAEPIGAFHIEDQQVSGTTDYIKDGEWPIDNGVIDVYAVPPVSVVPEGLVKAVRFYEQVKRENPPVETGAWKDAVDWVLKEACKAVSMLESSREHEVISQQEKA
ncbi:hypothetical protein NUC16_004457 [Salmonella enterica]|nr:hypothetical protein [Salmonella enterica]EIG7226848.1 hypothetical protein [Salmonella enterica]EJJ1403715.1 hypothetical protein [Salmonella enterica]EJP5297989.1 hypothetical protein [Salmonella enterica]